MLVPPCCTLAFVEWHSLIAPTLEFVCQPSLLVQLHLKLCPLPAKMWFSLSLCIVPLNSLSNYSVKYCSQLLTLPQWVCISIAALKINVSNVRQLPTYKNFIKVESKHIATALWNREVSPLFHRWGRWYSLCDWLNIMQKLNPDLLRLMPLPSPLGSGWPRHGLWAESGPWNSVIWPVELPRGQEIWLCGMCWQC